MRTRVRVLWGGGENSVSQWCMCVCGGGNMAASLDPPRLRMHTTRPFHRPPAHPTNPPTRSHISMPPLRLLRPLPPLQEPNFHPVYVAVAEKWSDKRLKEIFVKTTIHYLKARDRVCVCVGGVHWGRRGAVRGWGGAGVWGPAGRGRAHQGLGGRGAGQCLICEQHGTPPLQSCLPRRHLPGRACSTVLRGRPASPDRLGIWGPWCSPCLTQGDLCSGPL